MASGTLRKLVTGTPAGGSPPHSPRSPSLSMLRTEALVGSSIRNVVFFLRVDGWRKLGRWYHSGRVELVPEKKHVGYISSLCF